MIATKTNFKLLWLNAVSLWWPAVSSFSRSQHMPDCKSAKAPQPELLKHQSSLWQNVLGTTLPVRQYYDSGQLFVSTWTIRRNSEDVGVNQVWDEQIPFLAIAIASQTDGWSSSHVLQQESLTIQYNPLPWVWTSNVTNQIATSAQIATFSATWICRLEAATLIWSPKPSNNIISSFLA